MFVNAEQVGARSAALEATCRAWHRRASKALGTSAEEWAAAEQRMSFDRLATVAHQLAWMTEAGFLYVDCLFKHHRFAVLFAKRGWPSG